uniref:Uncharacterized protein n=1 Tax=Triticum urartu TaxID=4572 RepID=A0A8R7QF77_TRIUA
MHEGSWWFYRLTPSGTMVMLHGCRVGSSASWMREAGTNVREHDDARGVPGVFINRRPGTRCTVDDSGNG